MKRIKVWGRNWSGAVIVGVVLALAALGIQMGCKHHSAGGGGGGPTNLSSQAYKGHEGYDTDVNNFISTYPFAYGTRLDDCLTCHKGATVQFRESSSDPWEDFYADACTFCHFVADQSDDPTDPININWQGLPTTYAQTLNPYGADYLAYGRSLSALRNIEGLNSDGDDDGAGHEFTNREEILDLRFPGDPNNWPGQAACPRIVLTLNDIINESLANPNMPGHDQFMLANANKQQFDDYATYAGVKVVDLLREMAGVDLNDAGVAGSITSIQFAAPDGFTKPFPVELVRDQFPDHYFYSNLGPADLNECAFVNYPANTYGLADGQVIPCEQWHILAYRREGLPLEDAYLNYVDGRIGGEGPFRNAVPPWNMSIDPADPACDFVNPASTNYIYHPDWGKGQPATGCETVESTYPYTGCKAHNAGYMTKAVVAIRLNPVPVDCQPFDYANEGWAMIGARKIVIEGYGISAP